MEPKELKELKESKKQNLIQVVMNDKQIKETIILNAIKMFNNRGIIDENHISLYSNTANANINQNEETGFDLSKEESQKLSSSRIDIKFINRKLTTIRGVIDIQNFMDKASYKLVIVSNVAPKVIKQITDYKNTELFYDSELQINLIEHILVPKHIKLSPAEVEQLVESYQYKIKNGKRICIDDPVSRYYNLKVGDIVRIERPSINSGYAIDYRVVTQGSIY
jgi:DNA-directed RNA polymerase subunit H (RpoH/RPB5)